MRIENTNIWEDIKSEHTTCLCYSESKGLFISEINFAPEEDILFRPHGIKGFWAQEKQIPMDNLSIKIKTNFGYCSQTYMKAIVERDGKGLLDFDMSKLFVSDNCSVSSLDVEHYAWEELFEKIIDISKKFDPAECTTSAISYVEGLNNMLNENEILIKRSLVDEKPKKRSGEYQVTLFAAKKIKDLITGCQLATITDEYFIDKINELCHKWLQKIQEININLDAPKELSDCLFVIHDFMAQNGKGLEFLEYFISKTDNDK